LFGRSLCARTSTERHLWRIIRMMRTIAIFFITLGTAAWAADNCDSTKTSDLQAKFMKLNPEIQKDLEAGTELSTSAIETIDDFDNLSKRSTCRTKIWKAYVDLAQAQAPFDEESQAAQLISQRIRREKLLKDIYEQSLCAFADRSR